MVSSSAADDSIRTLALADAKTSEFLGGAEPKKVIVVRGRTINIVI
jgi:leucyl-tRNA synthetase